MLTKQAAEKLAQDYYVVGQQLAMQEAGLVKVAGIKNNAKKISKEALKEYLALLGGVGGGMGGLKAADLLDLTGPQISSYLVGAPLAAGVTSVAHQLSRKGLDKLIN